jgi:hypothetical protein
MKTKEEIEQEAKHYAGIILSVDIDAEERYYNGRIPKYDAFKAGAEFANPKWISVKEQKPLTDEIIHVWHRNELKKGKRCIVGNNELWHYEGESRLSYEAPTHWMPLPKSPEISCPQCKTEYTKEELLTNEHCFKCGFEMKGF